MIVGQTNPVEKKIEKISILEKNSAKLYFSLYHLIEKFKVFFFSNLPDSPRLTESPTTLIAKILYCS